MGLEQTAQEEAIVYENNVQAVIEAQLQGMDLDSIRAKAPLIMEQDIESLQTSIAGGKLSYTELTAFYLDRIARFDKGKGGINSVITINPKALETARSLDLAQAKDVNPLYGIPLLLKDNINTKDMPTSAGTYALKDFVPASNAQVVEQLQSNKAIILGKANLSELANFVDMNMPSGYSSSIGQTLNPFGPLMLSPSGSSSGSAAAVAANLAAASLGTETTGSIVSPAAIHSLVGMKPTKDAISTQGVVPLSSTMDAVGPIAKTVKDAIALFNASVADPAKHIRLDAASSLAGKRIGVFHGPDSGKLVKELKKLGATPLLITWANVRFGNEFVIEHDFASDFAAYAKEFNAPVKSLQELADFNAKDLPRRAKYGQGLIVAAAKVTDPQKDKSQEEVKKAQEYLQKLIGDKQLDAFAGLGEDACIIPCLAGAPLVSVPFGINGFGEPGGVIFFALPGQDNKLMNLAYAFEQGTKLRQIPTAYLEKDGH